MEAGGGVGEGGDAQMRNRDRDLSVRILLDQLQVMKNAESRNELRWSMRGGGSPIGFHAVSFFSV